jgi:NitT/TauT family transport system permease protein
MNENIKYRIMTNLCRFIVLGFLAVVWELLAHYKTIDIFYFSRPSLIILDFYKLFSTGLVLPHVSITMQATMAGLLLGSVLGVIVPFIMGRFDMIGKIIDPVIVALYGIPKLALGPLFILWFGLGIESKIFLSFIWVFFIMYFSAYGGFKNVEQRVINSAVLMGATPFQIIHKIILPSSVPWILKGLKTGIGVALLDAIVGEYIGSASGLGYLVQYAGNMFDTTRVLSTILVMTLIMVVLNEIVKYLEKFVLRWQPAHQNV